MMRGAVRLELVVVAVMLAVVLGIFLLRVAELQRGMERTIVEAEVLNLRTELQLEVASRIARGEEGQLGQWAGKNPLLLLGRDQDNVPPTRSAGGLAVSAAWVWDAQRRMLVYRFASGETLGLWLASGALAGRDGWALGGGLLLLRERGQGK